MPSPILLFVDADACPVKQEVYRVAERFVARNTVLKVIVVANAPIAVPRADFIERVVVGAGMDAARGGEEIDSFQQAGFALSIVAAQQNWAGRKLDGQAAVIAIMGQGKLADVHLSIGLKYKT